MNNEHCRSNKHLAKSVIWTFLPLLVQTDLQHKTQMLVMIMMVMMLLMKKMKEEEMSLQKVNKLP